MRNPRRFRLQKAAAPYIYVCTLLPRSNRSQGGAARELARSETVNGGEEWNDGDAKRGKVENEHPKTFRRQNAIGKNSPPKVP